MNNSWIKTGIRNALILVVFGFILASNPAGAEIKVLNLRHVTSKNALPMVRELLSSNGKVSEWENKLIVNASSEEIASIEEVLSQVDVPPVMLRIAVRRENRRSLAGHRSLGGPAVESSAEIKSPGWQLGNGANESEYFLRVRDGGQGFIMIAESLPFVREMLVLAHRHAGYRQSLDFQVVNSGFWIHPVLAGDTAHLDIRPHLEGFQKNPSGLIGLPNPIDLQDLGTSVRVPLGRWVDLAGALEEADEISRAIVAWKTGNSREETTLWLKVDRQKEDF